MIRLAQIKDRENLITLWQQAFFDSREYIEMFLDSNASFCKILVYEMQKRAVSAVYLLPVHYVNADNVREKAWYLYAAATLPEYRGRGFLGELLSFIKEHILEPVLLVPAQKSLLSYYERQGFFLWQPEYVQRADLSLKQQIELTSVLDCTPKQYQFYRNEILSFSGAVQWSEHFMEYICHENALWNEGTQKVLVQGSKRYIVMYQIQDDTLNVKEVLPKTEDKTWLYALMQKNHCTKAVITWQPPVMCNRKLYCKDDLQSEKGYFNLTMG